MLLPGREFSLLQNACLQAVSLSLYCKQPSGQSIGNNHSSIHHDSFGNILLRLIKKARFLAFFKWASVLVTTIIA